jgi:hypothetical protein
MNILSASLSPSTSSATPVAGVTWSTTTWRQEQPGVWVAHRGGIVIGALQCITVAEHAAPTIPFNTLAEAREAGRDHLPAAPLTTGPDAPTFGSTRIADRITEGARAVGAVLSGALTPHARA